MNSNSTVATNQVTPESLPTLEYNGKAVVTTSVLAQLYGTDEVRVRQNHKRNADRFEVGKHLYKVEGKELSDLRVSSRYSQIPTKARSVILWTERGAARHAKMLETDQAWDVFEKLEDHYFGKVQAQQQKALPTPLTPAQQRHIQKRAAELAHTPGNSFAQVYRSIKDKFSVGTYKDIASEKYPALCRFLQCEPLEGELLPAEPATPIRPTTRLSYTESDLMSSGMVAPDGKFRRWANCGPTNNPLERLLRELNSAKYDKRAVMVDDIAGAVGVYNAMTSMIANDTELMLGLENRVTCMREASRSMVRLTL